MSLVFLKVLSGWGRLAGHGEVCFGSVEVEILSYDALGCFGLCLHVLRRLLTSLSQSSQDFFVVFLVAVFVLTLLFHVSVCSSVSSLLPTFGTSFL